MRAGLLVWVMAASLACDDDDGLPADAAVDVAVADIGLDAAVPDAARLDGPLPDVLAGDAPRPPDVARDARLADAAVDVPAPDGPPPEPDACVRGRPTARSARLSRRHGGVQLRRRRRGRPRRRRFRVRADRPPGDHRGASE